MKDSPSLSRERLDAGGGGRLVLPVSLSAAFVQLPDVTVARIAAPAIRTGLDAGSGAVQPILAGRTLTYACLLITAARLGGRYGCHRLFVLGTVVFMAGSAAAASRHAMIHEAAVFTVTALIGLRMRDRNRSAVPRADAARAAGTFGTPASHPG